MAASIRHIRPLSVLMVTIIVIKAARCSETHPAFNHPESSCYQVANGVSTGDDRRAKYCEPSFENLAVNRPIVASSTCGDPPLRICRRDLRVPAAPSLCELCDSGQAKQRHPAAHLTDYHVHSSCWISGHISLLNPIVNLTLSLGKKHTIYYVSLTDCGMGLPDSIEAYKSADFGATWQLWHLFSSNCSSDYPERRAGFFYQFGGVIGPREVVCSDTSELEAPESGDPSSLHAQPQQRIVLSFSTNFKRASPLGGHDRDPVIADWMLATDIRLVLHRRRRRRQWHRQELKNTVREDDAFAFANIDVGGRCFCNGHAARCLPDVSKGGAAAASRCDCQHGTEGEDCERCRPFWVDLPWRRGTPEQPTQCRRCQCNGHTDRCHFDAGSYQFAAEPSSAGVCLGCRHNTAGRNCQYCRPGYHRNWLAPPDSARVCTLCNCHPLGSATGICDRDTGRCVCKTGVGGEKCDRCLTGFEQTSDPTAPCKKAREAAEKESPTAGQVIKANKEDKEETKTNGKAGFTGQSAVGHRQRCPAKCRSNKRRLSRSEFHDIDWAVSFLVQQVVEQRRWIRVSGVVQLTIRCSKQQSAETKDSGIQDLLGSCQEFNRATTSAAVFYVRRRHWQCACPAKLLAGRPYLLLKRLSRRRQRRSRQRRPDRRRRHEPALLLRDIVWPWEAGLQERLLRLEARDRRRRNGRQKN